MADMVNNPPHYSLNPHGVECIDAIRAQLTDEQFEGYLRGNIAKYQWRLDYKGKKEEDVKKSQWYMNRLVDLISSQSKDA